MQELSDNFHYVEFPPIQLAQKLVRILRVHAPKIELAANTLNLERMFPNQII